MTEYRTQHTNAGRLVPFDCLWNWCERVMRLHRNPYYQYNESEFARLTVNRGNAVLKVSAIALAWYIVFMIYAPSAVSRVYGAVIPWLKYLPLLVPLPFIFNWIRALKLAWAEGEKVRQAHAESALPIPYRQRYWARMAPLVRETLLMIVYVPAAFLFPLMVVFIAEWSLVGYDPLGLLMETVMLLFVILFYIALGYIAVCIQLLGGAIGFTQPDYRLALVRGFLLSLGLLMLTVVYLAVLLFSFTGLYPPMIGWAGLCGIPMVLVLNTGPFYIGWLDWRRDQDGNFIEFFLGSHFLP